MLRTCSWLALFALCAVPAAFGQNTAPPPPTCRVTADGDYGHTPGTPIQIGGSPLYGGARTRRYFTFLTGPGGETLSITRTGSTMGPDRETVLDIYDVTYAGLEKPLAFYVDVYHFTEPMAPRGLACGAPLAVGTPPPNPLEVEDQMAALADGTVKTATGPVPPIPLGDDGVAGFVLDRFRVLARPRPPGAEVPKPHRTIVVVKSQRCDGKTVAPTTITLAGGNGEAVQPTETFTLATRFAALATGVQVPEGSMGAVFQVDGVVNGVEVRATFDGRTFEIMKAGERACEPPEKSRF